MSYIPPIKIGAMRQMEEGWAEKMSKYIAGEVDNLVLESCVKVGCHVDKDELVKALRYDRDQYAKGYADGKRNAASPWHRVEDELPEKFVNVILANKRGKHYDIDNGWWNGYSFDRCAKGIYRNVTHWMPLPEPPKEDA